MIIGLKYTKCHWETCLDYIALGQHNLRPKRGSHIELVLITVSVEADGPESAIIKKREGATEITQDQADS